MAKIIGLPKLSPTMEEGTLAKWHKGEGDAVEVDELVAEVETDKATMEFRSFDKGTILKLLVDEGETVEQGTPVCIIGEQGEDVSELVEQAEQQKSAGGGGAAEAEGGGDESGEAEDEPSGDESGEAEDEPSGDESDEAEQGGEDEGGEDKGGEAEGGEAGEKAEDGEKRRKAEGGEKRAAEGREHKAKGRGEHGRVLASPLVRRLAREHDVDLAEVEGSGPGGRIVKKDLDRFLEQGGPERAAAPAAAGYERREPKVEKASQMRKTIARRLTEAKQTVPHYYLNIDVDAAPILAARKDMNAQLEEQGEKVSVNDLLIKACAVALRRMPEVNRSWQDGEILQHQVVDVSVAVAVPEGLLTPVVRDADRKGVLEIAREVRELAERAQNKKLKPEEMTDGTFSISNLGMFGIEDFAAVINPPEGAILAVGTIRDEPVVQVEPAARGAATGQEDRRVVPGKRIRLTMSCDHRVIDGAVGARWLALLKRLLESPATLLI